MTLRPGPNDHRHADGRLCKPSASGDWWQVPSGEPCRGRWHPEPGSHARHDCEHPAAAGDLWDAAVLAGSDPEDQAWACPTCGDRWTLDRDSCRECGRAHEPAWTRTPPEGLRPDPGPFPFAWASRGGPFGEARPVEYDAFVDEVTGRARMTGIGLGVEGGPEHGVFRCEPDEAGAPAETSDGTPAGPAPSSRVVAAGGWCAPSSTVYRGLEPEEPDGCPDCEGRATMPHAHGSGTPGCSCCARAAVALANPGAMTATQVRLAAGACVCDHTLGRPHAHGDLPDDCWCCRG